MIIGERWFHFVDKSSVKILGKDQAVEIDEEIKEMTEIAFFIENKGDLK